MRQLILECWAWHAQDPSNIKEIKAFEIEQFADTIVS
jgi:hypothetical protein